MFEFSTRFMKILLLNNYDDAQYIRYFWPTSKLHDKRIHHARWDSWGFSRAWIWRFAILFCAACRAPPARSWRWHSTWNSPTFPDRAASSWTPHDLVSAKNASKKNKILIRLNKYLTFTVLAMNLLGVRSFLFKEKLNSRNK